MGWARKTLSIPSRQGKVRAVKHARHTSSESTERFEKTSEMVFVRLRSGLQLPQTLNSTPREIACASAVR